MANTGTSSEQTTRLSSELKLIPRWSVALAALAFVGVAVPLWVVIPQYRHHPGPPVGMRVYFALTWSALAALYMLMIGYVSKDAPRRMMSAQIWMLVCFVMPAGVGSFSTSCSASRSSPLARPAAPDPERLPLLPSVRLSSLRGLRQLPSQRPAHRSLLRPLRPRPRSGQHARARRATPSPDAFRLSPSTPRVDPALRWFLYSCWPMTLKALIVDDEQLARDELQYLLTLDRGRRGRRAGEKRYRSHRPGASPGARRRLPRRADAGPRRVRGAPQAAGEDRAGDRCRRSSSPLPSTSTQSAPSR